MWVDDKSLIGVPMKCDRCGREAVHVQRYSGLCLCGEHLAASLEARARGLIRARGWVRPGDRIAVGLSGGKGSCSLLRFLSATFGLRRDLSLVAVTVDEGPGSGMDMARIRGIAEGMGMEWAGTGFGEPGGDPENPVRENPPSLQRRHRDHVLVSLAVEVGATKLALGTTLDDVAGSVFLSVIRGESALLAGGTGKALEGVPLVRPFSRIPEEELGLYARLKGIDVARRISMGDRGRLDREAAGMLAGYATRHPSTLFALANLGDALAEMTWRPSGWPFMERTGEAGFRRGRHLPGERLRDSRRCGEPARGTGGRVTDHG